MIKNLFNRLLNLKIKFFFSLCFFKCLKEYKLNVKDAITLLDREQGGPDNVEEHGIRFHSILKASDLLNFLHKKGKINEQIMNDTIVFLRKHTFQASLHQVNAPSIN